MATLKSEKGRLRRAIVVGAGRAGLSATLELAGRNVPVLLLSQAPSFQASSARDREGFNASPSTATANLLQHAEDTLKAGGHLAAPAAVKGLTEAAPNVLAWLRGLGVPFASELGGNLSFAKLPGSSSARTAHVQASTGRHLISSLDALVRTQQSLPATDQFGVSIPGEKLVRRLDYWRFVSPVLDDEGAVVGVLAQDCRTLAFKGFPADGVILASGDYAGLWEGAAANLSATGAALGACYRQGAVLANLEFVQHHPLVAVGGGASIALPEILRAHGARLLRKQGNQQSALDLTALDPEPLAGWLESLGPTLVKLLGVDPTREPIPVQTRALRALGGLWSDHDPNQAASARSQATSLSGLYAAGAAAAQYHGAGSLHGNLALGDIFGGQQAALGVLGFREAQDKSAFDLPKSVFDKPATVREKQFETCLTRDSGKSSENPHELLARLRRKLASSCGPKRDADSLEELGEFLNQLQDKATRVAVQGPSSNWNQCAVLADGLDDIIVLAKAIVSAASGREESRGSHQRTDFRELDAKLAKPTLLRADSEGSPELIEAFDYDCAGRQLSITQ